MTEALDDQPPRDLAAEQAVLGATMRNNAVIVEVAGVLDVADFYRPAHQAVYDCVLELHTRGEPVDAISVSAELDRRGDLARLPEGGAPYLHTLIAAVPTATNAGYYAEIVARKARARRLVEEGTRLVARAAMPDIDLDQLLADHQTAITATVRSPSTTTPGAVLLGDLLAEPDEPVLYRVDRLWPMGGRVLFAAQFKAGKTTADHNLVRSLVDGEPFLGQFDVTIPDGRVTVLDTELDRQMLKRWLRAQGIRKADRVALFSLRGKVSGFNILNAAVRRQWADQLRELETSVLVLDCVRPVLDAIGLDENSDAGRFLVAFDELLDQAGITEAVVIHHMGYTGERSRGSSRLRDWPDAEWKLVRDHSDEDNPAAPRYFSAYGRDVDVTEAALHYDPDTRHLTVAGTGGRKDAAARKAATAVLAWVEENPGKSGNAIEKALVDTEGQKPVRAALKMLVADGRLRTEKGTNRAVLYYPQFVSSSGSSAVRQRTGHQFVSSSIGDELVTTRPDEDFVAGSADELISFTEPRRSGNHDDD